MAAQLTAKMLGGAGDKVFPPTYAVAEGAENKYAIEERRMPGTGEIVRSVVLDSVASQANRFELALLDDPITFPYYIDARVDGRQTQQHGAAAGR